MLHPISDSRRTTLLHTGASLVATALMLMVLNAPDSSSASAAGIASSPGSATPPVPGPLAYPQIDVGHDPFIPAFVTSQPLALSTNAPAVASQPSATPSAASVRAVVLGDAARALVDDGGRIAVVSAGDALDGSTVSTIDAGGVVLASGVRIPLVKEGP